VMGRLRVRGGEVFMAAVMSITGADGTFLGLRLVLRVIVKIPALKNKPEVLYNVR